MSASKYSKSIGLERERERAKSHFNSVMDKTDHIRSRLLLTESSIDEQTCYEIKNCSPAMLLTRDHWHCQEFIRKVMNNE